LFTEAADSLGSSLRRASLAALGLLVGVAAVISVIAAGQGLRTLIVKEMGSFGRPTALMAYPNWEYLSSQGWRVPPEPFEAEDLEALRGLKSLVAGVSPVSEFRFTVKNGRRSRVARIVAVSSDYFSMERLGIASGRIFNAQDDGSMRRVVILGANLSERLFGGPGDGERVDPIGKRVEIADFGELEVIGVLKPESASLLQAISSYDSTNNGSLFIPASAAARFGADRYTYNINIEAASPLVVDEAKGEILSLLASKHGTWEGQPKYKIDTGKSALEEIDKMTGLVTAFISIVAGISLIVAGIGVMNVMLISVKERTREIGTRKAIGARGSWIAAQFLIESLLICLSGAALGVALAQILSKIVAALVHWPALVPSYAPVLAMVISVCIALLFGLLPAVRAAKLPAAEALRYE
jgi:putative ABC transport system permease protein